MHRYLTAFKNSHTQQAVIAASFVIALNGLLYLPTIYQMVGADTVLWINNLMNIAAALISVWLVFRLWRSSQPGESLRMVWGSLLSGLILWTVAEIIWDSYQLFLDVKLPSTSPADIAWILGYIAVIIGLVLRIRTFRMRPTKPWQFAALAAFGVLVILAIVFIIIPVLNDPSGGNSYEKLIDLFYIVSDMVLAFLALLLVLVLVGGLLSTPWAAIALSCFCIALSDLLYVFAISQGIYQVDPAAGLDLLSYVITTAYTFAYVLMALGLYLQARLLDAI